MFISDAVFCVIKLYTGERLDAMVRSIKEHGIITPIIVQTAFNEGAYDEMEDELNYEILSGHNRVNAAKIAGLNRVPAIIKDNINDTEARLIVTESNLAQRSFSDLSHSERAICLAQHYGALKSQGKQSDLANEIGMLLQASNAGVQIEHQKSRDKLGGEYGLSATNVTRYVRLSTLIPALLELVDNGKIAFNSAYQLSFIEDAALQIRIAELVQNGSKVDMNKATLLRKSYDDGNLSSKDLESVLCDEIAEIKPFVLSRKIINRFFVESIDKKEIEKAIVNALQFHRENIQKA